MTRKKRRKVALCDGCADCWRMFYVLQKLDKPCKERCVCGKEASLYRVEWREEESWKA